MVGTSKILTVSYGTFSCTLEGFDDSFNTMKAIAEYFRDLASDDRYFGAEPPTPDAEMLARIAEKEIARRVEARMDASGITLRPALTEAAAPAPEMPIATGDTSGAAIAAAVTAAAGSPRVEDTAEKDAAETSVEGGNVPEAEQSTAATEAETYYEESDATAEANAEAEAEEGEPEPSAEEELASSVLAAVGSAPALSDQVDNAEPEAAEVATPVMSEVPAHPDADSVAAKLQRIRAVVGGNAPAADVGDFSEDLTESFYDDNAETPDVADVPVAAAAPAVEAEEDEVEAPQAAPGGDMIARVLARHASSEDEPAAEEQVEDVAHATDEVEAKAEAAEAAPEDAVEDVQEAIEEAAPVAPRVVRIKRSDLEARAEQADVGPDLGMLDGADELDAYLEDGDDDGLSPEEEAELMEALGEDIGEDDADIVPEPVAEEAMPGTDEVAIEANADVEEAAEDAAQVDAPSPRRPGRSIFDNHPDEDENGLNRLLDEADAQMKEPEGNRRRAAIEQLKAAVAASEAGRKAGDEDDADGEVENAFREDLSHVVRPRRAPSTGEHRTERPRPAPLKLVASQRVDIAADGEDRPAAAPVRPRRVAKVAQATEETVGSFAEFAENMGARELPELLEAAAAYTAFVEGADEFSRPQIIRRVRAVSGDEFNREDSLRIFADLLRQGRFNKVRNGRFQVADDTRFNPERRAS